MKVAIIDVGSNSVRLLVAAVDAGNVSQLDRERVYLRLGDDAYRHGRIGSRKLKATRAVAAKYARIARKAGAERLETIVTAPGRQAENHEELVRALVKATRSSVVVLSADDEGRLAWEGAVARLDDVPRDGRSRRSRRRVVRGRGRSSSAGADLGALHRGRSAARDARVSRREPA